MNSPLAAVNASQPVRWSGRSSVRPSPKARPNPMETFRSRQKMNPCSPTMMPAIKTQLLAVNASRPKADRHPERSQASIRAVAVSARPAGG